MYFKDIDQWNNYQCPSELVSIMEDEVLYLEITEMAKRQTNRADDSLENLLKGVKSCQYESQADWATSKTGLVKLSGSKLNSITSGSVIHIVTISTSLSSFAIYSLQPKQGCIMQARLIRVH